DLVLFAWRAPKVGLGGRFAVVSRESLLLTNNVLLVVACASVLLGTLYPLLIDALAMGKISVGPPYFDAVFAPLMVPALFLMGAAPFARWKEASVAELLRTLRWAFVAAIVVAIVLPFLYGSWRPLTALGILLAAWIVFAGTLNFVERVQSTRAGQSFLAAAMKQPRTFFGMHTAHVGVAVFVVGVTMVQSYQEEKDVKMAPGETVSVAGYEFRFNGVREVKGPNYVALAGDFDLSKNGRQVRKMFPEKRTYASSGMPMTEAAIDAGLFRDLYVSLGEPIDRLKPEGEWAVRVYHKPFVDWIWGGCVLMALGGLIAIADRRYRIKARNSANITSGNTQTA
ncbi:MAG: cytochrome c-type biosis protein CcmF, partial [Pseudomonadota bacterium]|nr:cytochrome c-type biosis protein CcmF [Pseudomonadota bacterium]